MTTSSTPLDQIARWSTPDGAALRARILGHLEQRRPLSALGEADRDLAGIDLCRVRLPFADLTGARLEHARLDGADLSYARLDRAVLRATSAREVKLERASLADADLTISNFSCASLRRACLAGARLDGSVFLHADLAGTDLRGATFAGCDFEWACLIGAQCDAARVPRYPRGSIGEYAAHAGFPTFTVLARRYMAFLRKPPAEVLHVAEVSVDVCRNPEAEVLALLGARNWRFCLVGVGAMIAGAASPAVLEAAWSQLDHGSWVGPQLAAALFLLDPAFEAKSATRLTSVILPGNPAPQQLYRAPPEPAEPPQWTPTKGLASLAAAYRMLDRADSALIDSLHALDRAGAMECESGAAITREWMSAVVSRAPQHLRARWARLPASFSG